MYNRKVSIGALVSGKKIKRSNMIEYFNLKKGDFILKSDIEIGLKKGLIFDISRGGLLNGNCHENGGIKSIIFNEEINKYYIAEFEGKEFAVNFESYNNSSSFLDSINHQTHPVIFDSERIKIIQKPITQICNNQCVILDCFDKLCYAPYTFIVNMVSTSKYINDLINLNKWS
jgi:hypothetical protein